MPRTPWFVAGAPMAAVLAAVAFLLAPRPADAEPARVDDLERPAASVLAPLVDPVGRLAGVGLDRAAATTASMVAVATPPPPPTAACPAPDATFVDSWGSARSGGRRHKGVDMMAPHGSPVYAPAAGTIRASNSSLGGLGFWLEGDDGHTYFGSHMSTLTVREGRVEAGAPIGTVGSTGNAGGTPHLHFEVMEPGRVSVNPYPFAALLCPDGAG
ncbi:MAG TPA: M23 family metallopeptidase [Acidimicrobiales bacterium]|nr:M23 family metallopeptidase [Acidimicrobiales bacterium]